MANELILGGREVEAGTTGRAGAVIAIAVNGVLLYVAENLMQWDLDFLTDDYTLVLPAIRLSLAATIGANLARLVYRAPWFITITDAVSTAVGLYAAVRLFQVFPFDFDGADVPWELLVRALLIVAIAGSVVTIIVALFKFLALVRTASDRATE